MTSALLVGCGDLGSDVGLRLAGLGLEVTAIRRRADRVPAPLRSLAVDLTAEVPVPHLGSPDLLVVALAARPRTEEAYRATYVEGLRRALGALAAPPARAVLVSSTAVCGPAEDGGFSDESTPPAPADGPARVLLEAEQIFLDALPGGTVLRLSGLYGTSTRLVDTVREGRVTDPHRWTNRIHRSDAAAAVVHLLTRPEVPERLYLGTDDEPAQLGQVAAYLAARIGATAPPSAEPAHGHGKRLSNARLRSTGWAPRWPTYREGYAEV